MGVSRRQSVLISSTKVHLLTTDNNDQEVSIVELLQVEKPLVEAPEVIREEEPMDCDDGELDRTLDEVCRQLTLVLGDVTRSQQIWHRMK